MKRLLTAAMATTLIVHAANANGYFYDGSDLVTKMREYEKAEVSDPKTQYDDATEFRGFVRAIFDTLELSNSICASDKIRIKQVGAVVVKYINANPELWAQPASSLVSNALRTAFPCKR